jgi:hypothetical protein
MHRLALGAVAALLVVGLSGCGWFSRDSKLVCPRAVIAPDIGTVTLLPPGSNIPSATGEITEVSSTCRKTDKGIASDLKIDMTISGAGTFPYLVAVVDANETVLNEHVFTVAADGSRSTKEQVTVLIPTYDPQSGGNYAVLVGFKLTPDQLAYNRAHPR